MESVERLQRCSSSRHQTMASSRFSFLMLTVVLFAFTPSTCDTVATEVSPSSSCVPVFTRTANRSSPRGRDYIHLNTPESCRDFCRRDLDCIGYEVDKKVGPMKCWIHIQGESLMNDFDVHDFQVDQFRLLTRCYHPRTTLFPQDRNRGMGNDKFMFTRFNFAMTTPNPACVSEWKNRTYSHSVGAAVFRELNSSRSCLSACDQTITNCLAAELEFDDNLSITCWLHLKGDEEAEYKSLDVTYVTDNVHQFRVVKKCPPFDCVPRWRVSANQNSDYGKVLPEVMDSSQCLKLCAESTTCSAVDFNYSPLSNFHCFHHHGTGFLESRRPNPDTHQYVRDFNCTPGFRSTVKRTPVPMRSSAIPKTPAASPIIATTQRSNASSDHVKSADSDVHSDRTSVIFRSESVLSENSSTSVRLSSESSQSSITVTSQSRILDSNASKTSYDESRSSSTSSPMSSAVVTSLTSSSASFSAITSTTTFSSQHENFSIPETSSDFVRIQSSPTASSSHGSEINTSSSVMKTSTSESPDFTSTSVSSLKSSVTEASRSSSSVASYPSQDDTSEIYKSSDAKHFSMSSTESPTSESITESSVPESSKTDSMDVSLVSLDLSSTLGSSGESSISDYSSQSSLTGLSNSSDSLSMTFVDTSRSRSFAQSSADDSFSSSSPSQSSTESFFFDSSEPDAEDLPRTSSNRPWSRSSTFEITPQSLHTSVSEISQPESQSSAVEITRPQSHSSVSGTSQPGNQSSISETSPPESRSSAFGITHPQSHSSVFETSHSWNQSSASEASQSGSQSSVAEVSQLWSQSSASDIPQHQSQSSAFETSQPPSSAFKISQPLSQLDSFETPQPLNLSTAIETSTSTNPLQSSTFQSSGDSTSATTHSSTPSFTPPGDFFGSESSFPFDPFTSASFFSGSFSSTGPCPDPTATRASTVTLTPSASMNTWTRDLYTSLTRVSSSVTDTTVMPLTTMDPVTACKVDWKIDLDRRSHGAKFHPELTTVPDCLQACASSIPGCHRVDVKVKDPVECWIHTDPNQLGQTYFQDGFNEYTKQGCIDRDAGFCYPRYSVSTNESLRLWPGNRTVFDQEINCMMGCASNKSCTGFDFRLDQSQSCNFRSQNSTGNRREMSSLVQLEKVNSCARVCHLSWTIDENIRSEGAIPVPHEQAPDHSSCLEFCAKNLNCIAVQLSVTAPVCYYFDVSQTCQLRFSTPQQGFTRYSIRNRCNKECRGHWTRHEDVWFALIGSEDHPEWSSRSLCGQGCRRSPTCRVFQMKETSDGVRCTVADSYDERSAVTDNQTETHVFEETDCTKHPGRSESRICFLLWNKQKGMRSSNAIKYLEYGTEAECRNACIIKIRGCIAVDVRPESEDRPAECWVHVDRKDLEIPHQSPQGFDQSRLEEQCIDFGVTNWMSNINLVDIKALQKLMHKEDAKQAGAEAEATTSTEQRGVTEATVTTSNKMQQSVIEVKANMSNKPQQALDEASATTSNKQQHGVTEVTTSNKQQQGVTEETTNNKQQRVTEATSSNQKRGITEVTTSNKQQQGVAETTNNKQQRVTEAMSNNQKQGITEATTSNKQQQGATQFTVENVDPS